MLSRADTANEKEVLEAAIRAMEVVYGERDIQLFFERSLGIRREAIAETRLRRERKAKCRRARHKAEAKRP